MFGLTAAQWLKLAFILMKGVNFAMSKIDQKTWREGGYSAAVAEQSKVLSDWLDEANRVRDETNKMTDGQITDDLDKNNELRKD